MKLITLIRSWIGILIAIPWTFLICVSCILSGLLGFQDFATYLMHAWALGTLFLFGIRIEVEGEENLPEAGGGIIVFNHQSHFDIPALIASTRKKIRFGAKIELFKIPFFGGAMRAVGTLPIARDDRAGVMKIYKEAEERCAQGTLFVLAPEGTRQAQPVIGRFKKGPFLFAANAHVPLIPAVIKGAYQVLPKDSFNVNVGRWRRTIHIRYLPSLAVEGSLRTGMDASVSQVREAMVASYQQLPEQT